MASPLYRSLASGDLGSDTTHTVPTPAGATTKDILVAWTYIPSNTIAFTAPDGWTVHENYTNALHASRSVLMSRVLAGGDDMTYTLDSAATAKIRVACFSPPDEASTLLACADTSFLYEGPQGADFTWTAITLDTAEDACVGSYRHDCSYDDSFSTPTGFTRIGDASGTDKAHGFFYKLNNASTTGDPGAVSHGAPGYGFHGLMGITVVAGGGLASPGPGRGLIMPGVF